VSWTKIIKTKYRKLKKKKQNWNINAIKLTRKSVKPNLTTKLNTVIESTKKTNKILCTHSIET